MLKIFIFTIAFVNVLGSVFALDYFHPPAIFTDSPLDSFNHQKSWFYYSELGNTFIYQAYLPNFDEEHIKYKVSKRLVSGYQILITASKWVTIQKPTYLPTQSLLTFSDTINLPPSQPNSITSSYTDKIFTITIPPMNPTDKNIKLLKDKNIIDF